MKMVILLLCLALQSPVKPDRNGTKPNGTAQGEAKPVVAPVNENKSRDLSRANVTETPERYGSVEWANWALFIVGAFTGYAVWRQARVAKDTLLAIQRPKVVVKHISLIPGKIVDVEGKPTLQDDRQWRVACVIANIGGTRAEIVGSNLTIERLGIGSIDGQLPNLPPYGNRYSFGIFSIQPGERQEKTIALDANTETMRLRLHYQLLQKAPTTAPIAFFGFLHYRDASGIERRTGFGAHMKRDMELVRLEDNPNYEYTD